MKKSMLYFISLCFCLGAVALVAQPLKPAGFLLKDTTITTMNGQTLVVNQVKKPVPNAVDPAAINRREILAFLKGLPELPSIPSSLSRTSGPTTTQNIEGVIYTQKQELVNLTESFSEYAVLSPIADVMYPGALIQSKSLVGNQLAPVQLKTAPGTLTITNLLQGAPQASSSELVAQASLADCEKARMNIINRIKPSGSVNASDWEYTHARTAEQALIKLGLSFKGSNLSASFKGSYKNDFKTNTIVAKLVQKYYTVSFAPHDPHFFAPTVSLNDLKRYSGSDNPPAYISQVTYGRLLLITFEAQASVTEMKAAIDVAYQGGFSFNGNVNAEQKRILQSMSVKVSEIGGSGESVMKLLANPFGGELTNYLTSGATYSSINQGAPIQFTARYIYNGAIAKTSLTTSYSEVVDLFAPDEQHMLYVSECSTCDQVLTGINLASGDRVDLLAVGQMWAGVAFTGTNGPEGWKTWESKPIYPMPGQQCPPFALIARIGSGGWICAGESESIHADKQGQLSLSTNDDNLKNGSGTFQVFVSIFRRTVKDLGYHGVGKSD